MIKQKITLGLLGPLVVGLVGLWNAPSSAQESKSRDSVLPFFAATAAPPVTQEVLEPLDKTSVVLPGGAHHNAAWFQLVGNIAVAFVFVDDKRDVAVSSEDLKSLQLGGNQLVATAVLNFRRLCGEPEFSEFEGGIFSIEATKNCDSSAFFLDRGLWRSLLQKHPSGLVAALPTRGVLLFAPANNPSAIGQLSRFASEEVKRFGVVPITPTLFRFTGEKWSVFGRPR